MPRTIEKPETRTAELESLADEPAPVAADEFKIIHENVTRERARWDGARDLRPCRQRSRARTDCSRAQADATWERHRIFGCGTRS